MALNFFLLSKQAQIKNQSNLQKKKEKRNGDLLVERDNLFSDCFGQLFF